MEYICTEISIRKQLSAGGLINIARTCFSNVVDGKRHNEGNGVPLVDSLTSALAVFSLKYPSLLKFEKAHHEDQLFRENLHSLYGVDVVPSDTCMREQLDEVEPVQLRKAFSKIFAAAQRGKVLEDFVYMDGAYLVSVDGTGYFSSSKIHCDQCCVKESKDGTKQYYHQMLSAVLIHPKCKTVIPLMPEPILKIDGESKNDCERNATKRLLADTKREHPHLKIIWVADGLASNGPNIRNIKAGGDHYILGAKEGDHAFLYRWVLESKYTEFIEFKDNDGLIHWFRYLNNVPLNDANFDLCVNFMEYWEIQPTGEYQHFAWVTDLTITPNNLMLIMRGGRARWKVENETFNTLKNQGYYFEHNFGHGYKNLSSVFAIIMMLAFLIDQLQQHCCPLFQRALQHCERKKYLWEHMRSAFFTFRILSWDSMYIGLATDSYRGRPFTELDTS